MILPWMTARRTIEIPCTVDIEQTTESLHAYVELHGIEVGPGDQVIVHDAPTSVDFGEQDRLPTSRNGGAWRRCGQPLGASRRLSRAHRAL